MNRILGALGVGIAALLALWLTLRMPVQPERSAPAESVSPPVAVTTVSSMQPAGASPAREVRPEPARPPAVSPDWAGQVEAIRQSEEPEPTKAVRLLALFPRLPSEGKSDVIPELAALTPDENYTSLAGILTDPTTPEDVLDVLLTDLLDRPEELQLPLLLDVARLPQHPRAGEAIEMLGLQLGEEFGQDWEAWSKKISERLASRPE